MLQSGERREVGQERIGYATLSSSVLASPVPPGQTRSYDSVGSHRQGIVPSHRE